MSIAEIGQIELPYGYQFVPRAEIDVKNILYVRDNPGDSYESDHAVWSSCIDSSLEVAGIGTTDGPRLVAVGFLGGNLRLATIHDITEHPDYKHEGLNFLVARQLVRLANERKVHKIRAEELNPYLHALYKRLGFTGLGPLLSKDLPNK